MTWKKRSNRYLYYDKDRDKLVIRNREAVTTMPEGTGGGRGRGRGLSRGRGRGRSRRGGRGGGGGNNGNKGGDSTTPTKASSKGNNDSKKPNEQTPTKAPRVDPIEEKMRLMGDQVSTYLVSITIICQSNFI